jgi:hypothetical protein
LIGLVVVTALGVVGCSEASGTAGGGEGGTGGTPGEAFPCTEQGIRDAIAEGGGPHFFACDGPTTVAAVAEIVIDNDVILDGMGNLTVDGSEDHRVFSVLDGVTATLDGFAVTGGSDPRQVGGITNLGTLSVLRSRVFDNVGTGILNLGTLSLTDSEVSNNGDDGVQSFNRNTGIPGEVIAFATITNCKLSENGFSGFATQGEASVTNSTLSNNGLSGIANEGSASVTDCTVSGNVGSVSLPGMDVVFIGSGVQNASEAEIVLTNTTVSGNGAVGVFNGGLGRVTLVSCSVTDHSLADIASNGDTTLMNTVVAGGCDPNGLGFITSGGHNVESPGQSCGLDTDGTDLDGVSAEDLKLGPLQDNGGPTETLALGEGSAAINLVPETDCLDADGEPLTTDQRGKSRPGGAMCDAGAFEMQP